MLSAELAASVGFEVAESLNRDVSEGEGLSDEVAPTSGGLLARGT